MTEINEDFEDAGRMNPRISGFPPKLDNIEVIHESSQSEVIEGDCPNCGYRGRAAVYYGWNNYLHCPECGEDVMT